MAFEQGPYLQTAVFCEKVLQEKDGVLSLIRIIDRLTHAEAGPSPPEIMPKFVYNLMAVLTLKSGNATGSIQIRVELEKPSGLKQELGTHTLLMEGQDRGQNSIMNLGVEFTEQGLYWFNIYVQNIDSKEYSLLTRMPFRVVYLRVTAPQQRLM